MRDIAGTGLFSSEYIVSSKKFGNLDLSLGIGWGVLGADMIIFQILLNLDDEFFKVRNSKSGQGGAFSLKDWFSGKTALFGGLEYDLPKIWT